MVLVTFLAACLFAVQSDELINVALISPAVRYNTDEHPEEKEPFEALEKVHNMHCEGWRVRGNTECRTLDSVPD